MDQVVRDIYAVLGLQNGDLTKEFIQILLRDIKLFDQKQSDRGTSNIAAFGEKGILIRCFDKMARLKTIIWEGHVPQVSEPIENEWADLGVYSVIARLCREGKWPGVEKAEVDYSPSIVRDEESKCPPHNHTKDRHPENFDDMPTCPACEWFYKQASISREKELEAREISHNVEYIRL